MLVVLAAVHIVNPCVSLAHRVERIVGVWRQRVIVGVDHSDAKYARRGSMISLDFDRSSSLTNQQASAPSQSGFPKKHRYRGTGGAPSGRGFLQALKLSVHAIPARCDRDQELAHRGTQTIFGVAAKGKCEQKQEEMEIRCSGTAGHSRL
jgi:hypothetical protein